MMLFNNIYCDAETEKEEDVQILLNEITEFIMEDLQKIAISLPRKTGKKGSGISSNKVNRMIKNHKGKITVKELIIQYLLKGLLPVLETIILGGIYKKP